MTRLMLFLPIALLLAACSPALPTSTPLPPDQPVDNSPGNITPAPEISYLPQEGDSTLQRDPATIESKEILTLESFPLQYTLAIKGSLPTICHQLRVVVNGADAANQIEVDVYGVADPNSVCALVVAPFEVNISLNGYAPGTYQVLVNGELAGKIEVAGLGEGQSMKGFELYSWKADGGWYFSLLPGTNRMKTFAEVTDPALRLAGVDALKEQLKKVAAGEYVFWTMLQGENGLSLPPEEVVADIRAYTVKLGLQFEVVTP